MAGPGCGKQGPALRRTWGHSEGVAWEGRESTCGSRDLTFLFLGSQPRKSLVLLTRGTECPDPQDALMVQILVCWWGPEAGPPPCLEMRPGWVGLRGRG